jgi:hypothetical protein
LGDNYFLYQIWTEGNSAGRQFRVSEKEVQLAKNYSKPELVIVAQTFPTNPKALRRGVRTERKRERL